MISKQEGRQILISGAKLSIFYSFLNFLNAVLQYEDIKNEQTECDLYPPILADIMILGYVFCIGTLYGLSQLLSNNQRLFQGNLNANNTDHDMDSSLETSLN